mmetsp:Transcript_5957/g.16751  ORF Transcript_5957/g.16751 Transcript_5957/m.16751 type:complete len:337 (+) Transcript_5957:289-1299(+)
MQLVFRETAAENHQRAGAPRHDVGRGVGLPHGRVLRPGDLGPVRSRGRGLRDLHLRVACPLGGPDVLRRQEGELLLAAQHLQVDARAREVRGVALCESGLEERRPTRHGQAVDAHDQVLSPVAHDPRERALERAVLGHHQLRAERGGHAGAPQQRRVGVARGRREAAARQAVGRARHGRAQLPGPGLPRGEGREPGRGGLVLGVLAGTPLGPWVITSGGDALLAGIAHEAQHHVHQGEHKHHRRPEHPLPDRPSLAAAVVAVLPCRLAAGAAQEAEPVLRGQPGAPARRPRPSGAPEPAPRRRRCGARQLVVLHRGGLAAWWWDDQPSSTYEQRQQ